MTSATTLARSLTLAVLILGTASLLGPAGSVATFTDAHDGTGSITAANNFNQGGPGGGVTADAGGPYTVQEGDWVILNGSGSSTQQGNLRTYTWTQVSGPGGGWYWDSPWAVYFAPDNVDGPTQVVLELTVENNQDVADSDTTTITIQDTGAASSTTTAARGGNTGQTTADPSNVTIPDRVKGDGPPQTFGNPP